MTNSEIDAKVAEKVMGWKFYGRRDWIEDAIRNGGRVTRTADGWTISGSDLVWSPSTDWNHAAEVLEKMQQLQYAYDLHGEDHPGACKASLYKWSANSGGRWMEKSGKAETMPLAICLAALRAVGAEHDSR